MFKYAAFKCQFSSENTPCMRTAIQQHSTCRAEHFVQERQRPEAVMLTELYDNQYERHRTENRFLRFVFHFCHKFLKMLKGSAENWKAFFQRQ